MDFGSLNKEDLCNLIGSLYSKVLIENEIVSYEPFSFASLLNDSIESGFDNKIGYSDNIFYLGSLHVRAYANTSLGINVLNYVDPIIEYTESTLTIKSFEDLIFKRITSFGNSFVLFVGYKLVIKTPLDERPNLSTKLNQVLITDNTFNEI